MTSSPSCSPAAAVAGAALVSIKNASRSRKINKRLQIVPPSKRPHCVTSVACGGGGKVSNEEQLNSIQLHTGSSGRELSTNRGASGLNFSEKQSQEMNFSLPCLCLPPSRPPLSLAKYRRCREWNNIKTSKLTSLHVEEEEGEVREAEQALP